MSRRSMRPAFVLVSARIAAGVWTRIETTLFNAVEDNVDVFPGQRWRRMRDSNSRGVATNTLSKSVGVSPWPVTEVRDLGHLSRSVYAERLRT
jgi:hypothetical protein